MSEMRRVWPNENLKKLRVRKLSPEKTEARIEDILTEMPNEEIIDCWECGRGKRRIHCENKFERDAIMALSGSKEGGVYMIPNAPREYDVTILNKQTKRAKSILRSIRSGDGESNPIGAYIDKWDTTKGYRGHGWQKSRKIIRKRQDFKCAKCGQSEEELGRQLDIHHIDPWRKSYDSSVKNLIGYCSSCHHTTEQEPLGAKLVVPNELVGV